MSVAQENIKQNNANKLRELFSFINIGIVILIVCLVIFLAQAYKTYLMPFTAYAEADMSYLDNELLVSLSAGDLTHFHSGPMAFEQEAPNLPWGISAAFDRGDGFFERPYSPALRPAFASNADGLGPIFNHNGCESRHVGDGREKPPAGPDEMIESGFVRVSVSGIGPYGEPLSPKGYGHQIADRAIEGVKPEATVQINWIENSGKFPDGENYSLRHPDILLSDLGYGPMPKGAVLELIMAPPVHVLGLLEAIPEETLLAWADPEDKNGDGISGRPNYAWDLERGGKIMEAFFLESECF